jgi:hypothetical protein
MQIIETRTVMLKAARAVKLRSGLVLQPGLYFGTETRIRLEPVGSGHPRYTIKFTAGQLASIGAMNFDVTKFVRSKRLIVAAP